MEELSLPAQPERHDRGGMHRQFPPSEVRADKEKRDAEGEIFTSSATRLFATSVGAGCLFFCQFDNLIQNNHARRIPTALGLPP